MIKIEGLTNITPEELNHLSTEAIPKFPLALFNRCLRILNLKSMGIFMCNSQEIDIVKEADNVLNQIPKTKNPFVLVIRFLKFLYAIFFFSILFNYINLKWYSFFLQHSRFSNEILAHQFYSKLENSQRLFVFGKLCFRRAKKLRMKQESFKSIIEKLPVVSPMFYFLIKSDTKLLHKLSQKLVEVKAITNAEHFHQIFTGYLGNQVDWYFGDLSLLFMIELMEYRKLISNVERSKAISICFFDKLKNKPFTNVALNNKVSKAKLTNLSEDSLRDFLNKHQGTNSHKIYKIIREIYGF